MLVRLNIGRMAGHIQDIEISAARAMIVDGRASAVEYANPPSEEGVMQFAESDASKSAKSAKKK